MIAPSTLSQPTALSLAQAPMPQADADRKRLMKDAWKSYRGEFAPPLKLTPGQPDDTVISNRCAPIVDKGVSFLFGQVLKIECGDAGEQPNAPDAPGDGDNDEMTDFLQGVWGDDDDFMTLLTMLSTNGGVCGHAFAKLVPPLTDDGYPRVVVLDPQLVRKVTHPEDCALTLAYIIEYPTVAYWQKRQIVARIDPQGDLLTEGNLDPKDTWTISNYTRKGEQGGWQQSGATEPWPYPFAPIFDNQNLPNPNESWGTPDLTPDLIAENRVVNFLQSNLARIIKYHAHPRTWASGVHMEEWNAAIDGTILLPSPESKLGMLAPMENFGGLLSFIEDIRSSMDEQSRVPAVALGRLEGLPKGNISGVALQLLFQPLIEKTILKQRLYGNLIRNVTRAALVLVGKLAIADVETYKVNLHFQNLLPVDDLAAAQTALIWKQLGVSEATLLQGAGFDPDAEAEKSTNEATKKVTQYAQGKGLPPTTQLPPAQVPAADTQQQQQAGMGQN